MRAKFRFQQTCLFLVSSCNPLNLRVVLSNALVQGSDLSHMLENELGLHVSCLPRDGIFVAKGFWISQGGAGGAWGLRCWMLLAGSKAGVATLLRHDSGLQLILFE